MTVGASLPQLVFEGTITFASVASGAVADQTVTAGANLGGITLRSDAAVFLELKNLQAGLVFCNAHSDASGNLVLRFYNSTAGALTPTGTAAKLIQF